MEATTDGSERSGIGKHMRKLMDTYRMLIGTDVTSQPVSFWDIVVITTPKENLKNTFEAQIKDKYARNELPLGFPIHVTVDPLGPNLGNGGSTLYVVVFLRDMYKEELFNKRVLMIHSGGQSKRMPSASILGKIFSLIPTYAGLHQMLDIKLAMFLPFLKHMPPGVFVTCADDFLLYDVGDTSNQDLVFPETGFTALAHPSPVLLGTKHGVYVIEGVENIDKSRPISQSNGLKVLQKPSESEMFESGAILEGTDLTFSGGVQIRGHTVHTDSSYFFANDISLKILKFMEVNGGVDCEIDAYGDLLQPLGPGASIEYTKQAPNVTTRTDNLQQTREKLFHLLKGSGLRVVVMNASQFVHIGTSKEYIHHFCIDERFRGEMGLIKTIFNYWTMYSRIANDDPSFVSINEGISTMVPGCVMHSVLPAKSKVAFNSVVEYCHFEVPVDIGQNTVISNCMLCEEEMECSLLHPVQIPSNLFLQTVPIFHANSIKFATAAFHIYENLKQVLPSLEIKKLPILGKTFQDFCHVCDIDYTPDSETVSLWTLPVIPILNSMSESLQSAVAITKSIECGTTIKRFRDENIQFVSMKDITELKSVDEILKYRKGLFDNIKENQ